MAGRSSVAMWSDGRGRRGHGRPPADEPAQLVLNQLVAVGDQLFRGLEVVADGLSADLGLAGHVADRDLLVTALGEQPRGGAGDDPAGAGLLAPAQPGVAHRLSLASGFAQAFC